MHRDLLACLNGEGASTGSQLSLSQDRTSQRTRGRCFRNRLRTPRLLDMNLRSAKCPLKQASLEDRIEDLNAGTALVAFQDCLPVGLRSNPTAELSDGLRSVQPCRERRPTTALNPVLEHRHHDPLVIASGVRAVVGLLGLDHRGLRSLDRILDEPISHLL